MNCTSRERAASIYQITQFTSVVLRGHPYAEADNRHSHIVIIHLNDFEFQATP